ncbi:4-hydroxy-tetrahydrodipicolinate reductase [Virgibacillus oceani]|uniref:4-hydroxy-tetrahydrodipicolinate reductase n=1 Tax=Virgibacillus oceani TaxID=1479511 RepID=A0A917H2J6_9BACI|nr:4-hydroxy-tetrahydrodipicolinate reductase [Virgibacillus oceani]GGG65416.1 4-hydroxy-tetrahydrodipicolinate reductase [Virgibacillus oceani]
MIRVIIAGPRGKMGSEAIQMVNNTDNLELVACLDRKHDGKTLRDIESLPNMDVPIYENIEECFQQINADIFVDLTVPETGYIHTKAALKYHVRPVVGTSGFSTEQIEELTDIANTEKIGGLIAPNFAVGAVLMMQFAKQASKYFPDVEIIEKHHDQKLDAPSGTAIKTAELISEVRGSKKQGHTAERETVTGARGADFDGMKIHSIRLPGIVAHQEVIFGGSGQTLTIKHDSFNRKSFMAGIKLAIEEVMKIDELVYGLDNILE